jgi:hypothetical protein
MKFSRFLTLTMLVVLPVATSACASVGRGIGNLTGNPYAEPQTNLTWIVPPPQLEPLPMSERSLYISYRNISDAFDIDLYPILEESAARLGWSLAEDPSAANLRLRLDLQYFGEVEGQAGMAQLSSLPGIVGVASGAATGIAVTNATDNLFAGAVVGIGVGGLVNEGLSQAMKPRSWAAVVDIVTETRLDEPMTFEVSSGKTSDARSGAGLSSQFGTQSGGVTTANSKKGSASVTSNYYPEGARLIASACQMSMKREEALPLIEEKLQGALRNVLPR